MCDKVFNITKNLKYDAYQRVLASIVLIDFLVKSLYVIDVFGKYTWMIPLKYKKGMTITNGF